MPQAVSDVASNAQENIAHAASILGKSGHRRRVFDAIYTGKRRTKTVVELMKSTGLSRIRVLDAGKKLADNTIVKQVKVKGETAYEKIGFFHAHKNRILSLAQSPEKLKKYPTKRNPRGQLGVVQVAIRRERARASPISIDDIPTFKRAWKVEPAEIIGDRFSESAFKAGLKKVLGEKGEFKDWGGEVFDLYTTRLNFKDKRRSAAFALKGPATKGRLTPGKMGKNGDQLQRLIEAPADVFLVQYCRQIDQSVTAQLGKLAIAKSVLLRKQVWFGVIDGQDSNRLALAYPNAFSGRARRKSVRKIT